MKFKNSNSFILSEYLLLSLTEEFPCPYFKDGRINKLKALIYFEQFLEDVYELLLPMGFRRVKNIFYNNVCEECRECIPIRIRVDEFKPDKFQRRLARKNSDIKVVISNSEITLEKFLLYSNYLRTVHGSKERNQTLIDEMECIHTGYPGIIEMDYYIENKLVAVGIVDKCKDAISSVYFYYNPEYRKRTLGIYSIIKEIELAKELGKKYLYLGYYIANLPKMSYKANFKPVEVLKDNSWQPLEVNK